MNLYDMIQKIKPADCNIFEKSRKRWLTVAKPLHSLGRMEEAVSKIAAISGNIKAPITKRGLIIMCADNGVVEEGVTQCGSEITAMVTENFTKRKASVCIMAEKANCDLFPVDIGVKTDVKGVTDKAKKVRYGTANMTKGAAMTRTEAEKAIIVGINEVKMLAERGYNIIATGEMGIGNTTTSSAVFSVLSGMSVESVTGKGAGLTNDGLNKKVLAIKKAIKINKPDKNDITDVLAKVGGLDIAGLCGVFLGGAIYHVPIIADGFISATAALCACKMNSAVQDYILPSHKSNEPAGAAVLDMLGLKPYLDCGMFLGEGSGAVAILPLIEMAQAVYTDMQTFDDWDNIERYVEL